MSTTDTTITVKIPPNTDRYAFGYGYLSGCMRHVELYFDQLEKATEDWERAFLKERIRAQVQSFKAMDDALHAEPKK